MAERVGTKAEISGERLLQVAAHLFRQRGYLATNVREIARAANMKSGSIYYHYPSKEALLDTLARTRDQGVAILLVSDDFEDLRVCTRLLVMVRGGIAREFAQPPWERQALIGAVEGLDTSDSPDSERSDPSHG